MRKFTISNDVYVKDKLHTFTIYNYIIISLLPIIGLNIYNNIDCLWYLLLSILLGLTSKILLNDKYTLNIKEIIINSIIINLLIVNVSNIVIFIISNLIIYCLHILLIKNRIKINTLLLGLFIYYLLDKIINLNDINVLNCYLNNYIYLGMIIFSYLLLIIKKCIKRNIVITSSFIYLVISLILCLINEIDVSTIFNPYIFLIILYIIGNLETSPLNKKVRYIYGLLMGLILGLISVATNVMIIFILLFIFNIIIRYLDKIFIYKSV